MPVRVVTAGGDPVRIVTEGISDPVRIVTSGVSTPVIIEGGLAPTFVSGEVGTVDSSTVVITFSTDITAPCGDCALGFAVLVNGAPDAITACVIVGGNTVQLTLTTAVAFGDTVTISYDSAVGCIMESTGVTDLVTFPAQAVTNNVAGNGLLNNLIAYWPGNEANGNALDLHTNGLTLTDVNTVTSNPGNVYALARQYTATNNEYHYHVDDPLLSGGTVDLTIATWCYINAKGATLVIVSKGDGGINDRGYILQYEMPADRFKFYVSQTGATWTTSVTANTFGVAAINNWYLVICYHDAANDLLGICINNGVVDTQAWANNIFNDTSNFLIGATPAIFPIIAAPFDGRIGPTKLWKSNAGLGGVLTAAQRTALWNAGAGLPYASFTV